MTDIDHNKNIQRIIDVLKSKKKLFDKANPSDSLVRLIEFGNPPADKINTKHPPVIYVTSPTELQISSPEIGTSITDGLGPIITEYHLIVTAKGTVTTDAQKILYDILKEIRLTIDANRTFTKPSDGLDPVFVWSAIVKSSRNPKWIGKTIESAILVLRVQIGVGWKLTLPGLVLNVISIGNDNSGANTEQVLQDDAVQVFGMINKTGELLIEFEETFANRAIIEGLIDAESEVSVTLARDTDSRILTVYPDDLKATPKFDDIARSILTMKVVR